MNTQEFDNVVTTIPKDYADVKSGVSSLQEKFNIIAKSTAREAGSNALISCGCVTSVVCAIVASIASTGLRGDDEQQSSTTPLRSTSLHGRLNTLNSKINDDYYELSNTTEKLKEGHKHDIDNLLELFGNYEDIESKVDLNTEEIVDLQTKYQNLTFENSKLGAALKEQNERGRRFEEAKKTLEAHITQMDDKLKNLEQNQKTLEDKIDDLTSKHVDDINELTQEINNTVKNEYFERMLNYVLDGQQTIIAEQKNMNEGIDVINSNTNSTLDYLQEQLSEKNQTVVKYGNCDENTLLGTVGSKPENDSNCKLTKITTFYG